MATEPQPVLAPLADDIVRVTWSIPLGIPHVHCYLVRVESDGWMLVDTGLGLPDVEAAWAAAFATLDGPVVSILITHNHPDHVGGAADVARLTGAPVNQGRLDYERCVRMWGEGASREYLHRHLGRHGTPLTEARRILAAEQDVAGLVRHARDPTLLDEGDVLHGWQVLRLPGHADGHLALLRDGVLLAGDTILDPITPAIGLYPDSSPDPLADYLASLERIAELRLRIAYAGHGRPIADPAARAAAIAAHHDERLAHTARAVSEGARSAWEVALSLFPRALPPQQRRFAMLEALSHLEHLARRGELERTEDEGVVRYGKRMASRLGSRAAKS